MTIKIDLKRAGFPVTIGGAELWFDNSLENLRKLIDADEIAKKKAEAAQEKAKHIHLPDEINDDYIENIDRELIDAAIDVNKEFIAAQYDTIFGDGTFKKLYEAHPDLQALEEALEIVGVAIAKEIENKEELRTKKALIEDDFKSNTVQ